MLTCQSAVIHTVTFLQGNVWLNKLVMNGKHIIRFYDTSLLTKTAFYGFIFPKAPSPTHWLRFCGVGRTLFLAPRQYFMVFVDLEVVYWHQQANSSPVLCPICIFLPLLHRINTTVAVINWQRVNNSSWSSSSQHHASSSIALALLEKPLLLI